MITNWRKATSPRERLADWLTRNSSCDHRIKIRSGGNLCDFPHAPISSRVCRRLRVKRIYTNCLNAIQCESRVRDRVLYDTDSYTDKRLSKQGHSAVYPHKKCFY